jgi:hypothetical protein
MGDVNVDDVSQQCLEPQPGDSASFHPNGVLSDALWPVDSDFPEVGGEEGETFCMC